MCLKLNFVTISNLIKMKSIIVICLSIIYIYLYIIIIVALTSVSAIVPVPKEYGGKYVKDSSTTVIVTDKYLMNYTYVQELEMEMNMVYDNENIVGGISYLIFIYRNNNNIQTKKCK